MSHKLDDSEPHQSILHTGSLEEGEGNRWCDDRICLNAAGSSRLPAWRGEAEDTWLARASLSMSFREWEGNVESPTMHANT